MKLQFLKLWIIKVCFAQNDFEIQSSTLSFNLLYIEQCSCHSLVFSVMMEKNKSQNFLGTAVPPALMFWTQGLTPDFCPMDFSDSMVVYDVNCMWEAWMTLFPWKMCRILSFFPKPVNNTQASSITSSKFVIDAF